MSMYYRSKNVFNNNQYYILKKYKIFFKNKYSNIETTDSNIETTDTSIETIDTNDKYYKQFLFSNINILNNYFGIR